MDNSELKEQLSARFKELPQKVRDAITSSDVAEHLQALAKTHKLHLDQWAVLENEVMLTMLGFQNPRDLARNIAREVGMHEDAAEALAADISAQVFAPIRAELEALMNEPEENVVPAPAPDLVSIAPPSEAEHEEPPQEVALPPVATVFAPADAPTPAAATPAPAPAPTPATPPTPAPDKKVERAPADANYVAQVPSHQRPTIEGDLYREQIQ